MKIFVTGSSGFIGQHLVKKLQAHHEVWCMQSDLLNFDSVSQELHRFAPHVVVHLAARTEVERSFYEQNTFSQVNYTGSVNLIESASRLTNLKIFLFASTMEVYGWQPISDKIKNRADVSVFPVFDEHTEPNPNAPYAVAKFGVEKYLEYKHRSQGFPYAALRQTNCYGRDDNDFFVTEQIISQMLTNHTEIRLGNATPYRNFIYIDDLLMAWQTLIEQANSDIIGKKFTVGPNRPIQISAWADLIAAKLGWKGEIHWDEKPHRPGEIWYLNSGNDLISEITGWRPLIDYDQGLDLVIAKWKIKNTKIDQNDKLVLTCDSA